jgi:hypothetical protein
MFDFLGEYTVQILFSVWAIGFMLSIPLSIFVVTHIGKNLPQEKIDIYIPMFIIYGMILSWLMDVVLLLLIAQYMWRDFVDCIKNVRQK